METDLCEDFCENPWRDMLMIDCGACRVDRHSGEREVYSQPRVVPIAESTGLTPGWSLDIKTCDSAGRPWNFDNEDCRRRAKQLVRQTKPLLLICSPMCTWFSTLQNLNRAKMGGEAFQIHVQRALRHLQFVLEPCEIQVADGRHILFEHPAGASSWRQKCMVEFLAKHPVLYLVSCSQCMFGLTAPGDDGATRPVAKLTRWMTTSSRLAASLSLSLIHI